MSFKNRNYTTKTQLQQRAAKKNRQHNSVQLPPGTHIVEHEVTTPVFAPIKKEIYLHCIKCRRLVRESLVTEHLLQCQPNGAVCGKCKKMIPAKEFLEHFKGCTGERTKTAMPFPPPPHGPLSDGPQPIGIEPSGKLIFKD